MQCCRAVHQALLPGGGRFTSACNLCAAHALTVLGTSSTTSPVAAICGPTSHRAWLRTCPKSECPCRPMRLAQKDCPTLLQVASLPRQDQTTRMPAGRQTPCLTCPALPTTWCATLGIRQPPVQPLLLPLQLTAAQMVQRAASSLLQWQLVLGTCSAVQAVGPLRLLCRLLQRLQGQLSAWCARAAHLLACCWWQAAGPASRSAVWDGSGRCGSAPGVPCRRGHHCVPCVLLSPANPCPVHDSLQHCSCCV